MRGLDGPNEVRPSPVCSCSDLRASNAVAAEYGDVSVLPTREFFYGL